MSEICPTLPLSGEIQVSTVRPNSASPEPGWRSALCPETIRDEN